MQKNLLLVDDEKNILNSINRLLQNEGYNVYRALDGEEALQIVKNHDIQVILSDQRMPGMYGSELVAQAHAIRPEMVCMILSGYSDFELVVDAINRGKIHKFINKPWNNDLLRQQIKEAFNVYDVSLKDAQVRNIFNSSLEGILIVNTKGYIEKVNESFTKITGYSDKEVIGKNALSFLDKHQGSPEIRTIIQEALKSKGKWSGEVWKRRKDGTIYPEWLSITSHLDEKGKVKQYEYFFMDISDRKQSEQRAIKLETSNNVTGLYNRSYFNHIMYMMIKEAQKSQINLGLVILGLDRFKNINSFYGHNVGDSILRIVGQRLLKWGKKNNAQLFHLGGDEFAILIKSKFSFEDKEEMLWDLRQCFVTPLFIGGNDVYTSASLGVAFFEPGEESSKTSQPSELFKNASTALFCVKETGRNDCKIYNDSMDFHKRLNLSLENDLYKATEQEQFLLNYQPLVDLKTDTIHSVEVLLRWPHPKQGLIRPDQFIPLCEETGLIIPIGEWVLRTACQSVKTWQDNGFRNLGVSVNLSPRQFMNPGLKNSIKKALEDSGLEPKYLELEITESLVIRDPIKVLEVIKELKKWGVKLSIDDFGTGYSSLSQLKNFPFDTLKIDKTFIDDIFTTPDGKKMVQAVVRLAKNLAMKIVAEGVETQDQKMFLKSIGVDFMQGYFFSKPVPLDEMIKLLERKR